MFIEIVQLDGETVRINSDHIVLVRKQKTSVGLEEHTVIELSTKEVVKCSHKPEDLELGLNRIQD